MNGRDLQVRLLGPLQLRRERLLVLPASKKSRALLAYLVMQRQPVLRERLCELLWSDGPDDPRAELRWSLNKIRPLLGETLVADREKVAFSSEFAEVDVLALRSELGAGVARADTAVLERVASRFGGEFLEGLDLPGCFRFHEWCVAEREAARALRLQVLSTLTTRFDERPEQALRYARDRVAHEPLSEQAHIAVISLLSRLGRSREALAQYDQCKRILESELAARPSEALQEARRAVLTQARSAPEPNPASDATPVAANAAAPSAPATPATSRASPPDENASPMAPTLLVGRESERQKLGELFALAQAGQPHPVLLLSGEPGIGKSRLLLELCERTTVARGKALRGRAFEAERVRPYGPWVDALRSSPIESIGPALRSELAPLLPELGQAPSGADRTRLFDAVAQWLEQRAESGPGPVTIALDDLQWFDEASLALLHYLARGRAGARVLLALSARAGELEDNPAATRLVRGLVREGKLHELSLARLSQAETESLVSSLYPGTDAARVFLESQGNPLFAHEVARALARGESVEASLETRISERLDHLSEQAQAVVPWAAALGRGFHPEVLISAMGLAAANLLDGLEELERSGVLRAGPGGYDFVHDLVRRVGYHRLSEPRRRLLHRQLARALSESAESTDADGARWGELAHHASLGGDAALAVPAFAHAGERALRLFATAEAVELADRGLQLASSLPPAQRLPLQVRLFEVILQSRRAASRRRELEQQLSHVIIEAQEAGRSELVHRSFYLLSFIHWQEGDSDQAQRESHRSAKVGRNTEPKTALYALANNALCLAMLERELPHVEALIDEAKALAATHHLDEIMVDWSLGILHVLRGEIDAALQLLDKTHQRAARTQERWPECDSLTWMARGLLEHGRPDEALSIARRLIPVAERMGEGGDGPFALALEALARRALRDSSAERALSEALGRIRAVDSKGHLALAQNLAARQDLEAGRLDAARERAREALEAARAVGRSNEVVCAVALLAQLALKSGQRAEAKRQVETILPELARTTSLSARARAQAEPVLLELGIVLPTVAPTEAPTPSH